MAASTRYAIPLGTHAGPAQGSIYSGGAIPATTQVLYSNGTTVTGDSAFVRSALVLTADPNTDATFTIGYAKVGFAPGATSTRCHFAQASCYNSTDYAIEQTSAGQTKLNAKSGASAIVSIGSTAKLTVATSAATFASGVPVTISDTTVAGAGTGALIVTGGISAASLAVSGNITNTGSSGVAIAQSAAAGGTRQAFTITPAANVSITSGTESPSILINTATRTWATTVPSAQRETKFSAPTYACDTAGQTIATAATVSILGPPAAGTNVTITNAVALQIAAGHLEMVGTSGNSLRITTATANNTVATAMSNVGPTGAQTTIQGWLLINVNGTNRYIPFW